MSPESAERERQRACAEASRLEGIDRIRMDNASYESRGSKGIGFKVIFAGLLAAGWWYLTKMAMTAIVKSIYSSPPNPQELPFLLEWIIWSWFIFGIISSLAVFIAILLLNGENFVRGIFRTIITLLGVLLFSGVTVFIFLLFTKG